MLKKNFYKNNKNSNVLTWNSNVLTNILFYKLNKIKRLGNRYNEYFFNIIIKIVK
jgi:hypothetical protein